VCRVVQALRELVIGSLGVLRRLDLRDLVSDAPHRGGERVEPLAELGKRLRLQTQRHLGLRASRLVPDLRDLGAVGARGEPRAAAAGREQQSDQCDSCDEDNGSAHGGQRNRGPGYPAASMFDALSDKLQSALGDLRGRGVLDEEAISRAMREVRLALLEADVNFGVVKGFVAQVRERALGEDVRKSLTPGQQVVKIVHEELTELLGSTDSRLAFSQRPPTTILLAGLQGSGKTTAAGKLALLLEKEGKKSALVAADLQRPAAIDQLVQLGGQVGVPVYAEERSDPVKAVHDGIERARADDRDVVILDTAGRLHVDEPLMEELAAVRREAKPTNVLLVLDAMTGQEAVNVAQAFQERIDFDGVVLTKLDGDARGGAALSVRAVTGRPIKLASLGEKLDALDWFHPDRMASRILGMGDVLTLIERAEAAIEDEEKEELERRMLKGEFSFDDFLSSYKMLRRMGPLQGVLKMIPGLGKQLEGLDQVDERQLKRVEAIVLSMTPHERRVPHVIDASRRKRIAGGSGTTVEQVNQLIDARKQMAKMMKMVGSGKMPQIPGAGGPGNGLPTQGPPRPSATRKSKSKRKKKARR
jgi:signal recognition particle subunit SRP54